MAQRSIDGVFVDPQKQPRLTPRPAPVVEHVTPHAPKTKPLAHLAPYVPNVQHPPVTYLRPSHGEPRPPVVADGTVKHSPAEPKAAPAPAPRPVVTESTHAPAQPFALNAPPPEPAHVLPPRPVAPQHHQAIPTIDHQPEKIESKAAAEPKTKQAKKRSKTMRFLDLLQYPVLAGIALLAAQSTNIGQWFVLAYAVYAFIRRVPSQASFGMALFLLVSIPIFQLLHQPGIAQNIAVYVYELLVVGTVQAIVELYISRHKKAART